MLTETQHTHVRVISGTCITQKKKFETIVYQPLWWKVAGLSAVPSLGVGGEGRAQYIKTSHAGI
jgi:hypothetical protein